MKAKIRLKCPHCHKVSNVFENATICPICHQPVDLSGAGRIYLYRQGSFLGVAGGFGIHLNNEPYGHIGNRELLCFILPYGSYNIHCAAGMNRRCRDMVVNLSPVHDTAYVKVHMNPGFISNTFVLEPMDPALLQLDKP